MNDRILIVDDDPDDIAMLERFLSSDPVEIRGVTDSRQAQIAFDEFKPDLVLLDLHLPPPDGLAILRGLRNARKSIGFVPVVVLTGDDRKAARNSALVMGADDFLTKPLDRHEVVFRVRNLLRTRKQYVDLEQANEDLRQELYRPI